MAKRSLFGLWLVCFIFLIFIISAQSINMNYPNEVSPGEEFYFTLELIDFGESIYDVKIDITLSDERIAQIWDGEQWKSTYYYVNNVLSYDREKSFLLRIKNDAPYGTANVLIKIKDSSGNIETFEDYNIEIIQSPNNDPDPELINNFTPIVEEDNGEDNDDGPLIYGYVVKNLTGNSPIEELEPQLISLGLDDSKDIKTKNYMQEQEKSNYAIYGLIGFCIFLAFLYSIQKNKKNKNEFR